MRIVEDRGCSVQGCKNEWIARNLCRLHYERWKSKGDVGCAERFRDLPKECRVPGCVSKSRVIAFLCVKHKWRLAKFGGFELPPPPPRPPCAAIGCERKARLKGLCQMHYLKRRRHGDVNKVLSRARGTGSIQNGYVTRNVPSNETKSGRKVLREHRVLMAKRIGRELLPHETVHHKNGQRSDNRDDNLELWSKWQPGGQRVTDKIEWAVELLTLYAPEKLAANVSSCSCRHGDRIT